MKEHMEREREKLPHWEPTIEGVAAEQADKIMEAFHGPLDIMDTEELERLVSSVAEEYVGGCDEGHIRMLLNDFVRARVYDSLEAEIQSRLEAGRAQHPSKNEAGT